MRKYVLRLGFSLAIVIVPLIGMIATGTTPQLGLDLQGGISVVLGPKEGQKTNSDALDKSVDIIRNRVDALGVAEPEISRQGDNIIVDLPGVENRERARQLVGKTAELRFRPVLNFLPGEGVDVTPSTTTTTAKDGTTTTTAGGATTTTTAADDDDETTSTTKQEGRVAGAAADATTTTSAPTTTTAPTTPTTAAPADATTPTTAPPLSGIIPTSTDDDPTKTVVLPIEESEIPEDAEFTRLQLGPAELTGKAVKSASANFDSEWFVTVNFNSQGAKDFDALAAKYVGRQIAIVLDGVVQSFPTIQTAKFDGQARISGSFSQKSAKDLATVLRYGALPIALEERSLATVSPTLGRDQLRSGIVAGVIGLALVSIYMLVYYRLLGLVIVAGLLLASGALYVVTSYMSETSGLTLTLAGVTGIIVSVGITVDSYVVYFERLKDEVRSGKTIRSSVDRGFARSFRTILAADFVSLIGAVLLYLFTVGAVRGFAFFLGLSVMLDIFVSYFFMHPLVTILARSPRFQKARWLSLSTGLGVKGATA